VIGMRARVSIGLALAAVLVARTGAQDAPALPDGALRDASLALERLAWLGGCWARERAEPGSGEHWMPLAGGSLLGVSRSVRRGQTVAHEFMQIRRRADDAVVFIAQLPGQPETAFTLRAGPATEAVFENPQHDFPQRVIYRRVDGARMQARIEGQRQGRPAAVDFAFTRTACDAVSPAAQPIPPAAAGAAGKP
jgi:Domain of unknown function (DUF6265)